jgi:hypothetical protein
MVKMVSLKKSPADRRAEKDALGSHDIPSVPAEDEGVSVNLDHHHLMKMGVGGGMKSGHKVKLEGEGTVERSETRSTPEGERHSATIRLHRGGIEHEGEEKAEERGEIRTEIQKATAGSERAAADKDAARTAKKAVKGKEMAE